MSQRICIKEEVMYITGSGMSKRLVVVECQNTLMAECTALRRYDC